MIPWETSTNATGMQMGNRTYTVQRMRSIQKLPMVFASPGRKW